jgi:hypothetical protein
MANFKQVNASIKANFPKLDIQVVRGEGYVYFIGEDGWEKLASIAVHPVSTSTNDLIDIVMQDIQDYYLLDKRFN